MFEFLTIVPSSGFTLILLMAVLVLTLLTIFSLHKTEYLIYSLLIWFPVETLFLRYVPPDYYVLVKYFPEVLIYSTLIISWLKYINKTGRLLPSTPLNKWFLLFLLISTISFFLNWYNPMIWFFGVRQLFRFVLIFFIFLFEDYSHSVIKNFLIIGAVVIISEAALGIFQFLSGGALDKYLFFTDSVSIGNAIQLEGIQQDWAPGQRVFATLGRYDRLGSLLSIGLVMLFPWFYLLKKTEAREKWWVVFLIGIAGLVLTYSRASWISFAAGIFIIGFFLMQDKRIVKYGGFFGGALVLYLLFVIITQSFGSGAVDQTGKQTIRDRVVEAVSFYSWRQSYEGYGRFFFIWNTPYVVVREYPFFGVGLGNYGGGVAASLANTDVYEKLHLPFGIQNTWGQIDNNWLSIWGETGTLGLIVWILLFREIFRGAYYVQKRTEDVVQKGVALGVCGVTVAIAVLGFFGPYFEFRTLMLYFWLMVGITFYYFREHKFSWNFLNEYV